RYSSFGAFRLSPCALQSIKVDGLILSGRPRSHLPSTVANRRWLAQPLLDFAGHQGVAGRGEVIVADDVETLVPVPVGFARPEQCREQVDERLAMLLLAEPAPKRDLPAVAIALRDLLRPGIDDDRQRDISRSQQVGELAHVLQRALDAAIDAERLVIV